jgi:hypothetical protein
VQIVVVVVVVLPMLVVATPRFHLQHLLQLPGLLQRLLHAQLCWLSEASVTLSCQQLHLPLMLMTWQLWYLAPWQPLQAVLV